MLWVPPPPAGDLGPAELEERDQMIEASVFRLCEVLHLIGGALSKKAKRQGPLTSNG